MAPVAGLNITEAMLKSMAHDIAFQINNVMDNLMQLSQQSIFIGALKAAAMQVNPNLTGAAYTEAWNKAQAKIAQIEQMERKIATYEKTLEAKKTGLEQRQKETDARLETVKKMKEKNIKDTYTYQV